MRRLRMRSASKILRRALETASDEAALREGGWMIAGHEVARVRAGGLAMEASGKKTSGVSGASLSEAGRCLASRGSYSKTSGMLPRVGAKVEQRGESTWRDMPVELGFGDGCFPFRGEGCGEGREGCCLGLRWERGMETGVVDQKGTERRFERAAVCFPDPGASRESHDGAENKSMSNRCHQQRNLERRAGGRSD
jgi:hypothetical protein